jgi:aspartyl-tRNA(Asn)/glutamyl-tRNA(Gln) amidotransferase subunit B
LPEEKRARFVTQFGITDYDAHVLASDRALADYFDVAARGARKPKAIANWIINDLLSALATAGRGIENCPISAEHLDELANLIDAGTISSKQGKEVFAEMFASGSTAAAIVAARGLQQQSDTGAIEALCAEAIAANPRAVSEYKAGKQQSINFLKGQVMKLSQGKANPNIVSELLVKKLAELP